MRTKVSLLLLLSITTVLVCFDPVVGQEKAYDFTLTDIDGNSFSLSGCPAKVVLIDFFGKTASGDWCDPCIKMIPVLSSLYGDYGRDQLEIISITPESEAALRDFAQEQNMIWIAASDPGGQISSNYDIKYIPTLFMIDSDGYIRNKHVGVTGESTLRSEIDSLLSGGENGEPNGHPNGDSNGDSDGDPGGARPWISIELVGIIGVAVVCFLIIGIVVAGQALEWSKPAKKRGKDKR
jgi:peroxiredoxin